MEPAGQARFERRLAAILAAEIQAAVATTGASLAPDRRIEFRIGINMGDVVVEGRLDLAFEDIGEQALKNMTRPVRAYRVRSEGPLPDPLPQAGERTTRVAAAESPPLTDKPSIAVNSRPTCFTSTAGPCK